MTKASKRTLAVAAAIAIWMGLPARSRAQSSTQVQYQSGNTTVTAYLALPRSQGEHPAIIVIHEWWGLNDWVRQQAGKFADQGYIALAVDLYRGQIATDPETAHELSRGMPQDRAVADLKAAFDYLVSRHDVEADKIGVVGWCMGGGYAILLAENEPKLAACAVNYGALPTDPTNIARIKAPVLGNFGAEDHGIPQSAVNAFVAEMKAQGKSVDVKIYDGAGHAFENPDDVAGYRPEAAKDAWSRMLAFFNSMLEQ
ncbi:MAG TPA: dienelactone hydrolase family protein [Candidatus Acidoferrales bacterium]|nr:dienelactone hydrolase family protein [Candidatus Acidoferrales bacterium]